MDEKDVYKFLEMLDGSGSDVEYEAIEKLRELGRELPAFLLEKYRSSKKWEVRSSCVYHAIRYAREEGDAVQLGIEGLSDKSKVVRYRACMLLAYSLDEKGLPFLEKLEKESKVSETLKDAHAAIDAIKNQCSDFFVDRDHTGDITLRVN